MSDDEIKVIQPINVGDMLKAQLDVKENVSIRFRVLLNGFVGRLHLLELLLRPFFKAGSDD